MITFTPNLQHKTNHKRGYLMNGILLALAALFTLNSCGSVRFVDPDHPEPKQSTLAVVAKNDRSGTVGDLNQMLFEEGYDLVSYANAQESASKENSDSDNSHKPIYKVEVDYTYYYDLSRLTYKTFSAEVVDLNTGKVVMTASFKGDQPAKEVLSGFVQELSQKVI